MSNAPEILRSLATHFAQRDWGYTRTTNIKHIRYAGDFAGRHRLDRRLRRAVRGLFDTGTVFGHPREFLFKVAYFHVQMRTDRHLPDGVLDGGAIITHWEETGEYLNMVQPSVGEMLANFLLADPDHPHAVLINAELERILSTMGDSPEGKS